MYFTDSDFYEKSYTIRSVQFCKGGHAIASRETTQQSRLLKQFNVKISGLPRRNFVPPRNNGFVACAYHMLTLTK